MHALRRFFSPAVLPHGRDWRRSTRSFLKMPLFDTIQTDLRTAMKERREVELSTLRMVLSALKNRQIEMKLSRDALPDDEVVSSLRTLVKQRKDSIEQFDKAGRKDLADRERAELEVIQRYLPTQMTAAEIDAVVVAKIAEIKPQGVRDMGRLMQAVMPAVKGRAEGRLVNERVKVALERIPS